MSCPKEPGKFYAKNRIVIQVYKLDSGGDGGDGEGHPGDLPGEVQQAAAGRSQPTQTVWYSLKIMDHS